MDTRQAWLNSVPSINGGDEERSHRVTHHTGAFSAPPKQPRHGPSTQEQSRMGWDELNHPGGRHMGSTLPCEGKWIPL